jgi:hypothetical protein
MTQYFYRMTGTAAQGQTWETTGSIELRAGEFPDCAGVALQDSFLKLTDGKAVFGHPGLGCSGPYQVTEFAVQTSGGFDHAAQYLDEATRLAASITHLKLSDDAIVTIIAERLAAVYRDRWLAHANHVAEHPHSDA